MNVIRRITSKHSDSDSDGRYPDYNSDTGNYGSIQLGESNIVFFMANYCNFIDSIKVILVYF